jgi:hypothetical protein
MSDGGAQQVAAVKGRYGFNIHGEDDRSAKFALRVECLAEQQSQAVAHAS